VVHGKDDKEVSMAKEIALPKKTASIACLPDAFRLV